MIKFVGRLDDGEEILLGVALSDSEIAALCAGKSVSASIGDLGAELRLAGDPAPGRISSRRPGGQVLLFRADEDDVEERMRSLGLASADASARAPG